MPIEQLCMSAMAVIMLMAALMSTTAWARLPSSTSPPRIVAQAPAPSEIVECIVQSVDVEKQEMIALVEKVKTTFKVPRTAQVIKDRKPSEFAALAKGDVAILTLSSAGSDVVRKIEAVSAE